MRKSGSIFVLVHGIWHGGWCWDRVATILRSRGHQVSAPTHTGLGERSHLMSPNITMSVFVEDIVNHLKFENLNDVILVGHSFGGAPIIGAADRAHERIARLVFLDAAILNNGETWFDLLPDDIVADRKQQAEESSNGLSLPVAPVSSFGVTEPGDVAFLEDRLTPHPMATFTSPLDLSSPVGNGLPAAYIACTNPAYRPAAAMHERARQMNWPMTELATGHDAMVMAPEATANALEKCVIDAGRPA